VFRNNTENSVRVSGGSPRGVFVLSDGGRPVLFTSQTVFNNSIVTSSYITGTGGDQSVSINGVLGRTRILSIDLNSSEPPVIGNTNSRQVWRQLK
jgi:type IV pilus assembly protein PilY1